MKKGRCVWVDGYRDEGDEGGTRITNDREEMTSTKNWRIGRKESQGKDAEERE